MRSPLFGSSDGWAWPLADALEEPDHQSPPSDPPEKCKKEKHGNQRADADNNSAEQNCQQTAVREKNKPSLLWSSAPTAILIARDNPRGGRCRHAYEKYYSTGIHSCSAHQYVWPKVSHRTGRSSGFGDLMGES